jgi:hypothetical protein
VTQRRASHTRAEIKRALKEAAAIGAREVSIEPGAIRIVLGDNGHSGDKPPPRVVKKARSLM